jgi:putative ABC transport system substrate-binding protein
VSAKRLELLRELVPAATRLAVLVNPANPSNMETTLRGVEAATRAMGLQIQVHNVSTKRDIDAAFATFANERPDAVFVSGDPVFTSRRVQLVHLATRHALPATYTQRDFTEVGGLMSYGTTFRRRTVRPASTPAASSGARRRPTFRWCNRPSSS